MVRSPQRTRTFK